VDLAVSIAKKSSNYIPISVKDVIASSTTLALCIDSTASKIRLRLRKSIENHLDADGLGLNIITDHLTDDHRY